MASLTIGFHINRLMQFYFSFIFFFFPIYQTNSDVWLHRAVSVQRGCFRLIIWMTGWINVSTKQQVTASDNVGFISRIIIFGKEPRGWFKKNFKKSASEQSGTLRLCQSFDPQFYVNWRLERVWRVQTHNHLHT